MIASLLFLFLGFSMFLLLLVGSSWFWKRFYNFKSQIVFDNRDLSWLFIDKLLFTSSQKKWQTVTFIQPLSFLNKQKIDYHLFLNFFTSESVAKLVPFLDNLFTEKKSSLQKALIVDLSSKGKKSSSCVLQIIRKSRKKEMLTVSFTNFVNRNQL